MRNLVWLWTDRSPPKPISFALFFWVDLGCDGILSGNSQRWWSRTRKRKALCCSGETASVWTDGGGAEIDAQNSGQLGLWFLVVCSDGDCL